jgi:hypothetical protein
MIINYTCPHCRKYIVCGWRKFIERNFSDDTDMGKDITITINHCKEFDEIE